MNIKTATSLYLPVALCAVMALCTSSAMAAEGPAPTIQGRVMEMSDTQGFDQLTILTPDGERMHVRLGASGTCRGLVSTGDQVRISLINGTKTGMANLAMGMRVRRTGASYMFRNGAGQMNQQWTRSRSRDGSGDGTPGVSPTCPGDGSGGGSSRGGSGGGGGGQRGGGGGGGGR